MGRAETYFLERGDAARFELRQCYCDRRCPVHYACLKGAIDVLRVIFEQGGPNACWSIKKPGCMSTAMHKAVKRGCQDIVKILFDCGGQAAIDSLAIEGFHLPPPIHMAVMQGDTDMFNLLLEKGGQEALKRLFLQGSFWSYPLDDSLALGTALHAAAIYGRDDMIRIMQSRCSEEDFVKLLGSTSSVSRFQVVDEDAVARSLPINSYFSCSCKVTPLHCAVMRGFVSTVRTLVEAGAPLDKRACGGFTPLELMREILKKVDDSGFVLRGEEIIFILEEEQ